MEYVVVLQTCLYFEQEYSLHGRMNKETFCIMHMAKYVQVNLFVRFS